MVETALPFPCSTAIHAVMMTERFYISANGESLGPYAKDQLRSMWSAGQVTADTMVCAEGSQEWKGIEELQLSASLMPPLAQPKVPKVVVTKSSGASTVALGFVLCAVGVVLIFIPNLAGFGGLLLVAGFVAAVSGRLMS